MQIFGFFNMFSIMSIIFPIMFILIFGIIIFTIIKNIGEWNSNNKQPVISVVAEIVSKRGHTSRSHHSHGSDMHSSTSTSYYATFEVESGDRIELHIAAKEFGMIAEGDIGKLTFQGTRYHGFERIKINK